MNVQVLSARSQGPYGARAMKIRHASSPFEDNDDNHNAPIGDPGNTHLPGRRRFRVSPIAALAIAIAALVWLCGLENNPFGFHLRDRPVVSPEEAVDISLKRLMRTHVAERFEREHRLTSSPQRNREIIDEELTRIREHPVYALIKKQMTDYLRDEVYVEALIKPTQDANDPMVFDGTRNQTEPVHPLDEGLFRCS